MAEILLDYLGDAPIPEGYLLVTSDVDFLKVATTAANLQVRGSLCTWAESFCRGRNISYRALVSPQLEIQEICAGIEPEQAKQIHEAIGQYRFDRLERPITAPLILSSLSPSQLWHQDPSINHAADWLLWLIDFSPRPYLQPLLQLQSQSWKLDASGVEHLIYSAITAEMATDVIKKWVGLVDDPSYKNIKSFPRPIPVRIQHEARQSWKRLLIETRGRSLNDLLTLPLHKTMKAILVQEAYQYLRKHQEDISQGLFDSLSPFLTWQEQKDLQGLLPPAQISQMPETPQDVLEWFRRSYLPYRRWQFGKDDRTIRESINTWAKHFGLWYLSHYPEAISSESMKDILSFTKIVDVTKNSKPFVTLIVVLDGLHVGDAQTLSTKIQQTVVRLNPVGDDVIFTPLPTVTEFAKSSLFMGVAPSNVDLVDAPIGKIIPENETPLSQLSQAQVGDVFLWRVQEPDRTYHTKGRSDLILRNVEAELEAIAKVVSDIVDQTPAELPLQLIITTDHGRLIDSSQRKFPAPKNMVSHGRAAWGKADMDFGESDFIVDNELAYLKGERYGMKCDVAVCLNEATFLTADGKSGKELFPHGGVYPEEVIIPWIAYVRDYVAPEVVVELSGMANAGAAGELQIAVINYGEVAVSLNQIHIEFDNRKVDYVDLNLVANAGPPSEFILEIDKWPTTLEIKNSKIECEISQPNGLKFTVRPTIKLQSNEMYYTEDILEGLT